MSGWALRLLLCLLIAVPLWLLFTFLYSLLMGLRDNFRRYVEKSDLQWTGRGQKVSRRGLPTFWIAFVGLLVAWFLSGWLLNH